MLSCFLYYIIYVGKALFEEVVKENYFCNFKCLCSKLLVFGVEIMVDELYEYFEN